jgi:hypothetical protein
VLVHVKPERAGAAAGILTTTQQFGVASGVAVIGAVFFGDLGGIGGRGSFVSAMELAMTIDAILLVAAAAVTLLLPRPGAAQATQQVPDRQGAAGPR